ncbi:hypothetical protein R2E40_10075 [Aeromonas sp. CD]|uniref:hypothetical protein n=1 Tax=Aeromonas sp. CD TaxID=3080830 RepID=UPI002967165B|nr:hypothetical protein [Aeromonas sp. CD]WOX54435.1 hypothetical protein R2E40_10075 [Aeromonas sp. CD]
MESITIAAIWQWITAVVIPAAGALMWSYRNEIKMLSEFKVRSEVERENMQAKIANLEKNQLDLRAEIRDEIRTMGQDIKADMAANMAAIRADIKESRK